MGGWALNKRRKAAEEAAREVPPQAVSQAQAAAAEASWDDVSMVDQLGLEVGYRLIPLVDHAQNGELLHRIRSLRKKFAQDVGFLPPWSISATTSNSSPTTTASCCLAWKWAMAWPCPANGWRSTRAA